MNYHTRQLYHCEKSIGRFDNITVKKDLAHMDYVLSLYHMCRLNLNCSGTAVTECFSLFLAQSVFLHTHSSNEIISNQ